MGQPAAYLAQLILPGLALAAILICWGRRVGASSAGAAIPAAMSAALFIDIGADLSPQSERWHLMPILLAVLAGIQGATQVWAARTNGRAPVRVLAVAAALGFACAALKGAPGTSWPAWGSTFLMAFLMSATLSRFDRRVGWATGALLAAALAGLAVLQAKSGAVSMAAACATGAIVSLGGIAMGDHHRATVGPMAMGAALFAVAQCGAAYDLSMSGGVPWVCIALSVAALGVGRRLGADALTTPAAIRRVALGLTVIGVALLMAFRPWVGSAPPRAPGDPMDGIYGK